MATSKIDLSGITAAIPEAVQELRDLLKTKAFEYGDLQRTLSLVDDVNYAKKIGFIGELNDLGMTSSGTCSYNTVAGSISSTEKTWTENKYDTKLTLCSDDIAGTIAMKTLKKGVNKDDMTDTEYLEMFLDAVIIAIAKMYWRMAWIADKDAANTDDSPAGNITAGVDLKYVNTCDGLWKRARAIIAAEPLQRITIDANALTTTLAQNTAFTKALALEYANNIYYNAPLEIQQVALSDGFEAKCTVAFFNKLIQNFQSFELETMKTNLENGLFSININGINFVPVPEWDKDIAKYENQGAYNRDPFRCIMYAKENALLGVPSISEWGNFKSVFSEETDQIYIKIKDKIDALFLYDNMVMLAI